MKRLLPSALKSLGYEIKRTNPPVGPIQIPTEPGPTEILWDNDFQASVREVRLLTLLDTARLANLWQLCRMANPNGAIIEIGSYRGGSALHLSNSCPDRPIFVCDTFEGFGSLHIDPELDQLFDRADYAKNDFEFVKSTWKGKDTTRKVTWLRGYFPQSAEGISLPRFSFAHIDVDIYQSTVDTLFFLRPHFLDRSIILFDDYLAGADGLMKAVREFERTFPDWRSFPMYPGQGLMVHESWFSRSA
jgi:hypothetical protein